MLGPSTSTTEYAFQLGANYIDYVITMQHHCVQQIPNLTRCRTSGTIEFTPRIDVWVSIEGHYNYFMPTDPMLSSVGARVQRPDLPSSQQVLFGDADNASTLFNPAAGTLAISAAGLVPAGHHYYLFYQSQISFLGGAPATATGNGQIHFRVTEVPEPAVAGLLALTAPLVLRRRPRRTLG